MYVYVLVIKRDDVGLSFCPFAYPRGTVERFYVHFGRLRWAIKSSPLLLSNCQLELMRCRWKSELLDFYSLSYSTYSIFNLYSLSNNPSIHTHLSIIPSPHIYIHI